jgi:hypothetical protein
MSENTVNTMLRNVGYPGRHQFFRLFFLVASNDLMLPRLPIFNENADQQ